MKVCSNCGRRISLGDESIYCVLCGSPLVEKTERSICSNENCARHRGEGFPSRHVKYCDLCASPVIRVEEAGQSKMAQDITRVERAQAV